MRYLSLYEVLEIHRRVIQQTGGTAGIRDVNALMSALAQPLLTVGGKEVYPTVVEKAAALGFSLVMNHPFIDGNKRTGHAVMETFLLLNGYEIRASVDEQEAVLLRLAAGRLSRQEFAEWVRKRIVRISF